MSAAYDFHLHSCLSPCGDEDMTPYNLVNMAALMELEVIALTDHNSCLNCAAAMEAGRQAGITVVPGMELCTSEEIHVVCLFPALEQAQAFGLYVRERIPPILNNPRIYGRQVIMDAEDGELGEEELLLVTASQISIMDVKNQVARFEGACYPAHADKASYSVLSALGDIPKECGFAFAELSRQGDLAAMEQKYPSLRFLRGSDAHYLEQIGEAEHTLPLCRPSAADVVRYLNTVGDET